MSDTGTGGAATRPTIAVALAQFLAEQEERRSPRTMAQYCSVVELLQYYLNDYAYTSLDGATPSATNGYAALSGAAPESSAQSSGPSTSCHT